MITLKQKIGETVEIDVIRLFQLEYDKVSHFCYLYTTLHKNVKMSHSKIAIRFYRIICLRAFTRVDIKEKASIWFE